MSRLQMTDHELNKYLADAFGIEVEEYNKERGTGNVEMAWLYHLAPWATWAPVSDWSQALACAKMLGVDWRICTQKGFVVIYGHYSEDDEDYLVCEHIEDHKTLLVAFCTAIYKGFQDV